MGVGLGPASLDPLSAGAGAASTLLFQDHKKSMDRKAEEECEFLEPNTREMTLPKRRPSGGKRGGAKAGSGGGGGFGAKAAKTSGAPSKVQQAHAIREEAVRTDGVCLVQDVMSKQTAAVLHGCVADELSRARAAVEEDPSCSVARFNVPVETHDPLRGYLLLPLRDEGSVEAAQPAGPIVSALRELLAEDSKLGQLFGSTCGGGKAELYDLVALRTEPGAARQIIHYDTPYQKVPGLFCAFIALHDVEYEMGTTVFIPGTHVNSAQRRAFEDGQYDGGQEAMLRQAQSRYTLLKAGDAAFFDMRTLHAGTANFVAQAGGRQRLLFILTFRNLKAKQKLGHAPNLRPGYRHRGITLAEMRAELDGDAPFAGLATDGQPYGDGLA